MSIIYKQFYEYVPLKNLTGLQWFALKDNYGESYGNIHKKYKFIKTPKLLDIGNANVRQEIENRIAPSNPLIFKYSDPDEQYSGTKSNKQYHNLVKEFYYNDYDGTIIDSDNLIPNDKYGIDELEGPYEIVLWKNIPELLEEIKDGGRKTRKSRKTRKTRKVKKNKTIRKI